MFIYLLSLSQPEIANNIAFEEVGELPKAKLIQPSGLEQTSDYPAMKCKKFCKLFVKVIAEVRRRQLQRTGFSSTSLL